MTDVLKLVAEELCVCVCVLRRDMRVILRVGFNKS